MCIDLKTKIYLQKLESEIRQQIYWGITPEIPIEWQPDQLVVRIDSKITLPTFLTKLWVFEKVFAFDHFGNIWKIFLK